MFREESPPELFEVMSIRQGEEEVLAEHWRNLMTTIELKENESNSVYFFYKSKCNICFLNFRDSVLLYQKSFKVVYAQVQEITAIKIQTITIRVNEEKRKDFILIVGFMDGLVEVYSFSVGEKLVAMQKVLSFDFWERSEPVTGIGFRQRNMYVSRAHSVWVYQDCLSLIANLIVEEITNPNAKQTLTYDIKKLAHPLRLGNMNKGTLIHFSLGPKMIHVYNESEGARTLNLETHDEKGSIIDSILFLQETLDSNMVIGDTNDKVKIIYKNKSLVERYTGFKNYTTAVQHLLFPHSE